ncbi:hypothetical protein SBRY_30781 [Actinacidiphila bryophytorum]|uniref:Uncharacterized protein n=1 Tax=Actinacidiphila bryophytorum TaxID=1436133 RepID=A0A9W4MA78_9ACTN|nr:hypothetical protein SBRY_30781 [Actinacidiphila bryophytorum]
MAAAAGHRPGGTRDRRRVRADREGCPVCGGALREDRLPGVRRGGRARARPPRPPPPGRPRRRPGTAAHGPFAAPRPHAARGAGVAGADRAALDAGPRPRRARRRAGRGPGGAGRRPARTGPAGRRERRHRARRAEHPLRQPRLAHRRALVDAGGEDRPLAGAHPDRADPCRRPPAAPAAAAGGGRRGAARRPRPAGAGDLGPPGPFRLRRGLRPAHRGRLARPHQGAHHHRLGPRLPLPRRFRGHRAGADQDLDGGAGGVAADGAAALSRTGAAGAPRGPDS